MIPRRPIAKEVPEDDSSHRMLELDPDESLSSRVVSATFYRVSGRGVVHPVAPKWYPGYR
jgi:hypothetical protein